MDQAMVKRAIGAVVLAIIAALLLGYLLKDKTRERQEVVDMQLPGTSDLAIPDLVTPATPQEKRQAMEMATTPPAIVETSSTASDDVVASAAAIGNNTDPGFAVRPSVTNETREIIDNKTPEPTFQGGSAAIAVSSDPVEKIVASTTTKPTPPKPAFKPTIVEDNVEEKVDKKPVARTPPTAPPKPVRQSQKTERKPVSPSKLPSPAVAEKAPGGTFSIQLLATSSQSRAAKLANTMRGEGYKVFVTQTRNNDKVLYRVRVGNHANREAAVKAQEGMKRRYQKNFFVQNSLVIGN